ncbi:MAG: hypothetical protein ACLUOF_02545 [Ruminococcus sp.]
MTGLYLAYITNYKDYYLLVPTSNCCVPNFMISVSPFLMAKFLDILSHAKYTKPVGIGLTKVLSFSAHSVWNFTASRNGWAGRSWARCSNSSARLAD